MPCVNGRCMSSSDRQKMSEKAQMLDDRRQFYRVTNGSLDVSQAWLSSAKSVLSLGAAAPRALSRGNDLSQCRALVSVDRLLDIRPEENVPVRGRERRRVSRDFISNGRRPCDWA